jgi:hypothetical protein
MRTAWTNDAAASSRTGEVVVPSETGRLPVTIAQLTAAILHAAMQPIAARQGDAHIVAWRCSFVLA